MKPQETKLKFIQMRAEGKSYSFIAGALNISKSTCSSWETELGQAITDLKQAELNELYEAYYMTKEARIKMLGNTLTEIDSALNEADLSSIPAEKLLDYKLKYMQALKEEYTGKSPAYQIGEGDIDAKDIVNACGDLLTRVRAGDVTTEQANRESTVLSSLLKMYDLVEVKNKVDALEDLIGGQ